MSDHTTMDDLAIKRVVVLGGGTAGWIAAAALSRVFRRRLDITVVESPDVPIVGVGEATIPAILNFLRFLGADEQEFVAATQATCKLGIVFQDWSAPGDRYWHPFGSFGAEINNRPFHHYWQRAKQEGRNGRIADYSLAASLGQAGRVLGARPSANTLTAGYRHALHFDAALVGQALRRMAEQAGVARLEGTVTGATRQTNGHLQALMLADGRSVAADLFIDCSGFRGALIGGELGVAYQDWRHWLPCDRALAAPSAPLEHRPPYTLSAAHGAGWRWQIPLQHRTGNGVVYSSRWMTDAQAEAVLLEGIGSAPQQAPRQLRFTTGRREAFWVGNCVSLGLASGFLEPLELTSIHLVVSGILKLIDHFPDRRFGARNIDAYNRFMTGEFDEVRDFIILHYCLAGRRDTPFWQYCATMSLPDSLLSRIDLYRETGRILPKPFEIFSDLSWFYVFEGLGVEPAASDPIADLPSRRDLFGVMDQIKQGVAQITAASPGHHSFFARSLRAAG